MLTAHGVDPERLLSVKPTEQQLEFARRMHALREHEGELFGRYSRLSRLQISGDQTR